MINGDLEKIAEILYFKTDDIRIGSSISSIQ
jgi:hypothetical protein